MEEQGRESRSVLLQRLCSPLLCLGVFQPCASLRDWQRHLAKVNGLPSQEQSQTVVGAGYSKTNEMWYLLLNSSKISHLLNVIRAMEAPGTKKDLGVLFCIRGQGRFQRNRKHEG